MSMMWVYSERGVKEALHMMMHLCTVLAMTAVSWMLFRFIDDLGFLGDRSIVNCWEEWEPPQAWASSMYIKRVYVQCIEYVRKVVRVVPSPRARGWLVITATGWRGICLPVLKATGEPHYDRTIISRLD